MGQKRDVCSTPSTPPAPLFVAGVDAGLGLVPSAPAQVAHAVAQPVGEPLDQVGPRQLVAPRPGLDLGGPFRGPQRFRRAEGMVLTLKP